MCMCVISVRQQQTTTTRGRPYGLGLNQHQNNIHKGQQRGMGDAPTAGQKTKGMCERPGLHRQLPCDGMVLWLGFCPSLPSSVR